MTQRPAPPRRRARARVLSPLDIQLAYMRALWAEAMDQGEVVDHASARLACDIAKAAAPYVHTRAAAAEPPKPQRIRHEDALEELD